MTDKEKLGLVKALNKEYLEGYADEEDGHDAHVFLTCIEIVLEFGGADNATD